MGLRGKAEKGRFPALAPIEYKNARDSEDKAIILVDDINAFYVRRAFEMYATGNYSLQGLGDKLFLDGFKNKHGKPYPTRKFEEILKNIFYIGDFMWSGIRYSGIHTPLVSRELFYKVQEKFGLTNKSKAKVKKFTYTNFIKCTKCDCYLTAENKKGGHNSGSYTYYRCTKKKQQHTTLKNNNIREEVLDLAFQGIIDELHVSDELVERLKDKILKSLDNVYRTENTLLDKRTQRIKELDHLINKSYEDKILGKLPPSFTDEKFNEQHALWQKERDNIVIELNASAEINKKVYRNINVLINFCHRLPELFTKASIDDKRIMLRLLVDKATYNDGTLLVTLKPIFESLRMVKDREIVINTKTKVRTLKNINNIEQTEIKPEFITSPVNAKVRTLKTVINTKKEPHLEALKINGADDGT